MTEQDFLECDQPIRGQNYVCLSFISPENVLKNKDIFKLQQYLRHLVSQGNINLSEDYIHNLEEKYKDFLYTREEDIEREFYKKNEFKTTVRGIKVRGVYDTEVEAKHRAARLQKTDKNFNVYVGQVGYWLPWDPTPNSIQNQEYFESELNNLVKKYNENQTDKDTHFRENIDYVKEQNRLQVEEHKNRNTENTENTENTSEVINSSEVVNDSELNTQSVEENIQVSDSLKNSLESEDPWMARKK